VSALTEVALSGAGGLGEGAGRANLAGTVAGRERANRARRANVAHLLGAGTAQGAGAGRGSADRVQWAILAGAALSGELSGDARSASVGGSALVSAGARCALRGTRVADVSGRAGSAHGVLLCGEGASRAGVTDGASGGTQSIGLGASRAVCARASSCSRNASHWASAAVLVGTRELSSRAGLASSEASVGARATGARIANTGTRSAERVAWAGLALTGGSGEEAREAGYASSAETVGLVASRARHAAARASARSDGVDGAVLAGAASFGEVTNAAGSASRGGRSRSRATLASETLGGSGKDRVGSSRALLAKAVAVGERASRASGTQRLASVGLSAGATRRAGATAVVLRNSVLWAGLASSTVGEGTSRADVAVTSGSVGCRVTTGARGALGGSRI